MALPFRHPSRKRAFTLIELLTSVAVLLVMLTLLAQMVEMISRAWKDGMARVDNFSQTRAVMSLIERDIQAMVLRPDVAAFPLQNGSSVLALYTRMAGGGGSTTNRKVSLVQYAIDSSGGSPQFLRYDNGGLGYPPTVTPTTLPPELQLGATGSTLLTDLPTAPLTLASKNTTAVPTGLDQAQILVNGVVAFHVQFLRISDASFQPAFQFDYANPSSPSNTPTVVVSIVVLDNAAYQLAGKLDAFPALATSLAGNPGTGQTYGQYWNGLISNPGFGASLPQAVRSRLRVFERRICLPLPLVVIK